MSENRWKSAGRHDIKLTERKPMNIEDRDTCYEIFRSKDARYDGRFFIGITTTGIYCRPVCRARLPRPENCRYFRTAAEAEKAGFRPCLRCHPERAPGASRIDASSELARRALNYLRDNSDSGRSLAELSSDLGCSERHLRRVFQQEYHVTPVEYLQTCRLLTARQLLMETPLSVIEIAMSAGFGSVRRMNELFRNHYGMTPTTFRHQKGKAEQNGTAVVSLGYRPPYAWPEMLSFLKARAIPHVEHVTEQAYERTVSLTSRKGETCQGTVRVTHDSSSHVLKVEMSGTLVPVMPRITARIRQMFDLDCDPEIIDAKLESMRDILPEGIVPGIRLPGCFDVFEMACRAVIGQQITVQAASTLCGRLAETYGTPIRTDREGLDRIFPDAQSILAMKDECGEKLGRIGIISSRAHAMQAIAEALETGEVYLNRAADPETEAAHLMTIRGIGSWTAGYIAMRTMGWTDAFLENDAGIRRSLPALSDRKRRQLSEEWKPWRSYAMMNLWHQEGKGR
jgi:AraC family transcriptional regulator of adaptative response / DNA-3-methyladenine glycosylase II